MTEIKEIIVNIAANMLALGLLPDDFYSWKVLRSIYEVLGQPEKAKNIINLNNRFKKHIISLIKTSQFKGTYLEGELDKDLLNLQMGDIALGTDDFSELQNFSLIF